MKMNELMSEATPLPGPAKKADKAVKLAGAASDLAGASGEWIVNQLRKADPRQIWDKSRKTTYSSADKQPGGVLSKYEADKAAAAKAEAENALQLARQEKAGARIDKLEKIKDKKITRGQDTSKVDDLIARQDTIKTDAAGKIKDVPTPVKPEFTSQSIAKYAAPLGITDTAVGYATGSEENPGGYSATGFVKDQIGKGIRAIATAPTDIAGSALTGTDSKTPKADAKPVNTDTSYLDDPVTTKESIADILKLSGQKSITERDSIAGIVRPKEIVALHENKQLDECGMMPSSSNTTASLSINATAGNGQEVANMLAAIMNLAGVKPVSSDMLGTSATPPMPIVKAIDIISRGDSDSMNHAHDHEGEEPLIGMEEEYANTPEDPTEVPELDTNKLAYQPNAVDVGDRMDGTMPKGFPQVTQESLLQAYNQFKNGQ